MPAAARDQTERSAVLHQPSGTPASDIPGSDIPGSDIPGSDVLASERRYLATSRAELARMRERTLALRATGGNAYSDEALAASLQARAASLLDDPSTPLFFGRTDAVAEASGRTTPWYIGRRHVHDERGDPLVVDWRADISRPFYRASRTEPMGVVLRRRFGFDGGRLTSYEDEHLLDATEGATRSTILSTEIERPRTGPMRDIVATIQPEQDAVVRADITETICVQGAPGTGKTAVGLHRAAYLLYAHRDRLKRSGVLVVGPNTSFLSYIGAVLPALGELSVKQLTLDELVAHVRVRSSESAEIATLKGDARMAIVLGNAVWSQIRLAQEALVLPRGSRRWRVPTHAVQEVVDELRNRGVRYSAGRALVPRRLAHLVLVQMEAAGDSPDDRVQDAVARSRPVRAVTDAVWPALDAARVLLRLFTDAQLLRRCADGILSHEEQAKLIWAKQPRSPGNAPWTLADAVLIDEVRDLLERLPSLGHVVLDEAQDLSPMQLRAVGRRCSTGSATVLGDVAQGTTPWATPSWEEALGHLGKPDAHIEVLDRGYRVPAEVIDFAAQLLPTIAPGLIPPVSVREHAGVLRLTPARDLWPAVVDACRAALSCDGSVGVICSDAAAQRASKALERAGLAHAVLGQDESADRLTVVPATLAKGLEYDWVVVAEPADVVAAEVRGLRRLYVVLTRAVSGLEVVHTRPLPPELAA